MPIFLPEATLQKANQIREAVLTGAPDTVKPLAMAQILQDLRDFTNQIEEKLYSEVKLSMLVDGIPMPAWVHLVDQVTAWKDLLSYYEGETAKAKTEHDIAKTVYAPLFVGVCYGAPSCTQALADQAGPDGMKIAPRLYEPFSILNAMNVAKQADMENSVVAAVSETVQHIVETAGRIVAKAVQGTQDYFLKPFLITAAVVLGGATAWWLISRMPKKKET
jgi:hypothetical protein